MGIPFDALYGAGEAQPAPDVTYRQAHLVLTATEAGLSGTLLVNDTGRALGIDRVRMVAGRAGDYAARGIVHAIVGWGGVPPPTARLLAVLAISPEKASDTAILSPQAILVPPGEAITYGAWTATLGGASQVYLTVTYYLAEVT